MKTSDRLVRVAKELVGAKLDPRKVVMKWRKSEHVVNKGKKTVKFPFEVWIKKDGLPEDFTESDAGELIMDCIEQELWVWVFPNRKKYGEVVIKKFVSGKVAYLVTGFNESKLSDFDTGPEQDKNTFHPDV